MDADDLCRGRNRLRDVAPPRKGPRGKKKKKQQEIQHNLREIISFPKQETLYHWG